MTELPILLSPGFTPLVTVGDTLTAKQPIAERKATGNTVVINIAEELTLPAEKAGKTMRKNPGDTIEPGDVIAVRSGFLGMGEQRVVSSVSGTILTYERRTADVTIRIGDEAEKTGEAETLLSPIDGKVAACDNEKIVIETSSNAIAPISGTGASVQAPVLHLKHEADSPLPLHLLSPDTIGKIVVAHSLDRDGLVKAIGIEVAGVIVTQLDSKDEDYLNEKDIEMPVLQVSEDDYKKIVKWSGKPAYLEGKKKSIVLLQV